MAELIEMLKARLDEVTLENKRLMEKQEEGERKTPQVRSILDATIICRKKHKMSMLKKSPYFLRHAICDWCYARKISKFQAYFFHCEVCNYDLCPSCAKK